MPYSYIETLILDSHLMLGFLDLCQVEAELANLMELLVQAKLMEIDE